MTLAKPKIPRKQRVAFVIRHVGDYHAPRLLRLQADLAAEGSELLVIEAARSSVFYRHKQSRASHLKENLNCITFDGSSRLSNVVGVARQLLRHRPDSILVLGYSDELSLSAFIVGKLLGAAVFFLCDSKADDQPRSAARDRLKSLIISRFNGALVAGARHKAYFSKLGLSPEVIETGFDVIDNSYFESRSARYRKKQSLFRKNHVTGNRYVLCVSRLVRRKRVDRAIDVFHNAGLAERGFKLLIVGDGPEQPLLEELIKSLSLEDHVLFCGAVKSSRMPLYYAYAEALILASEYDQWGLVVNEALSCGVPVLITERCGAAGEILLHGVNGYIWDGKDTAQAGRLLDDLVSDQARNRKFGAAGKRLMASWGLDRFSASARHLLRSSRG